MPFEPPAAGVLAYLAASGSVAVFALELADGTVAIEAGADPWAAAKERKGELLEIAWTSGDRAADIVEALRAGASEGRQDQRTRAAWAFERMGPALRLATHDRVLAAAVRAVAIIDATYEGMKATGNFKRLNREYKAARKAGMKAPSIRLFPATIGST